MRYRSVTTWRDLTDGHLYHEGSPFPHDGREIPADRVASLETGRNGAGLVLIERVAEPETQEKPERETQAKPKRARKK